MRVNVYSDIYLDNVILLGSMVRKKQIQAVIHKKKFEKYMYVCCKQFSHRSVHDRFYK